jgi:hypothetical protein
MSLTRQLILPLVLFKLVLRCGHIRFRFWEFCWPTLSVCRCVAVLDVFACFIRCTLLGTPHLELPRAPELACNNEETVQSNGGGGALQSAVELKRADLRACSAERRAISVWFTQNDGFYELPHHRYAPQTEKHTNTRHITHIHMLRDGLRESKQAVTTQNQSE